MNTADRKMPQLLTPSKVTAWLDCAHYLTLKHSADGGELRPNKGFGELAQLLMAKGIEHEKECLAEYQRQGRSVHVVPDKPKDEDFGHWVTRVGDVMSQGHDVIYQMPFVHGGMRGVADFLIKRTFDDGTFTYEPLDAKLARKEAKPGHVLQLCFYADAIEAAGRRTPESVHIWLGSGRVESIRLAEVRAYWRRLQRQLKSAMEPAPDAPPTVPVKCAHCDYCEFAEACNKVWRDADALQFVANIRTAETEKLMADGVPTLAALAVRTEAVAELKSERLSRLVSQAALQVTAREMPPESTPPFHKLVDATPEEAAAGLAAFPRPNDGDVFLDYEGHPFWRPDTGLFFLFGLLTKNTKGEWTYEPRWAHSKDEEGAQAKALIEYFAARRQAHPGMHVYHYNHTERSALEAMAAEHGADQTLLQELIETGLFIDLFPIVRNSLQAGVESYGLKSIERLAEYERSHDIDKGSGAVVEYDRWMKEQDKETLPRIATYNEDDVRATQVLRDWLLTLRAKDDAWRVALLEIEDSKYPDIDAQVAALLQFENDTPQHLMGDLLGYWLREWRANIAKVIAKASKDPAELLDDPEAIGELEFVGYVDRFGKNGKPLDPGAKFRFPAQELSSGLDPDQAERPPRFCFRIDDATVGWLGIDSLSVADQTVTFIWNETAAENGFHPSSVVANKWVSPDPKPETLSALAGELINGTLAPSVTDALLRATPPKIAEGEGPKNGKFTDNIDGIIRWVKHLDRSYLPIQGPPGTGKTFTGAHIVLALAQAGFRVGITAMSHPAIDNMLTELKEVGEKHGGLDKVRVVRKGATASTPEIAGLVKTSDNKKCTKAEFNVVAGTTWLFASKEMAEAPVDVLIVDEAGQLGLADALAASRSAKNMVLLGDPLQLAQVSQATHPGGAGKSVLEHAIGEGNATIPPERGVFLTETRRMHPDVCTFISDEVYDGRLTFYPSCATQGSEHGTGLRWLQAHHQERSTVSPEEADLVVDQITLMLGSKWTSAAGKSLTLEASDFMVVAPYNDQVRHLRERLAKSPTLAGVQVGTVDKFQGQQAAVVFFTMTSSSSADMARESDFLFSRNRLNVAISRARCLAYVVCTEDLLNSRARDIDEMKLISTLCAAVDYATCSRQTSD